MEGVKLFEQVKFILAECDKPEEIKGLLLNNGAKHINYLSDVVTHVISDRNCPEADEAIELYDKPVVSSIWVHLSLKANIVFPPEAFSLKKRFFSHVTATFSKDISSSDVHKLAAATTFHGGKITKNAGSATHFIAISARPSDFPDDFSNQNAKFKLVAPDWILDSIKQGDCCEEILYEPSLLKGPPPPTPSPPPTPPLVPLVPEPSITNKSDQQRESQQETVDKDLDESIYRPQSLNIINDPAVKNQTPIQHTIPQRPAQQNQTFQQRPNQLSQQLNQNYMQPRMQPIPPSQLPRPRMGPSMLTRVPDANQPRFRPMQPTDPVPMGHRPPMYMSQQMMRPPGSDQSKIPIDPNGSYRKTTPYQNGPDIQHLPQQEPPYQNVQHNQMQHQGQMINQNPQTRTSQPNMYPQNRSPYPNNQMQQRMAVNQQQMMSQPMQPVDRFQGPTNQAPQRPYQIYSQQQQQSQQQQHIHNHQQHPQMSPNYPQGPVQRPQAYYPQSQSNTMNMRPQQMPVNRPMISGEAKFQDGYNYPHPVRQESLPLQQNHAHYPPNQPTYQPQNQANSHMSVQQQQHRHQHPPQQQHIQHQHQPASQHPHSIQHQHLNQHQLPPQNQQLQPVNPQMVMPPRQFAYQSNTPGPQTMGVRGPRISQSNASHEIRTQIVRPAQPVISPNVIRLPRAPAIQSQPHPSIFDNKQETTLAQLRAKVPKIVEDAQYYGFDANFKPTKDRPLSGCIFKMIEHQEIHPEKRALWIETIEESGGKFASRNEESNLTHLICETRKLPEYNEALLRGIRCITAYWVNDVLASEQLRYPWKALHIPRWFDKDDKPLKNHRISTSNIKGREKYEVIEIIRKSGAEYTDVFSQKNTILICGVPGGRKYEKAIEWKTPITNVRILVDFILGDSRDFSSLLSLAKYQIFDRTNLLNIKSYSRILDIMLPWTKPITGALQDQQETNKTALTNGLPKNGYKPRINPSEDSGIATSSSNSDADSANKPPTPTQSNNQIHDNQQITDDRQDIKQMNDSETITDHTKVEISTDKPVDESKTDGVAVATTNKDTDLDTMDAKPPTSSETKCQTDSNGPSDKPSEQPMDDDVFVDCKETQSSNNEPTIGACEADDITTVFSQQLRTSIEPVRILFTGLDKKLISDLQNYILDLKLGLASNPNDCTHLLVDRVSRTPKFICAFNHARYILNYRWLVESHKIKQLLDEKQYLLQDPEGEDKFSFNLVHSLLKRKKRACGLLFHNFIFFVTPTVSNKVTNFKEMIESAGGVMITRKLPSKFQLNQMRSMGKKFVVISSSQDLYLVSSMSSFGVEVVGPEFIMSGILRQDIDFEVHRLKMDKKLPGVTSLKAVESIHPSPSKKLRID